MNLQIPFRMRGLDRIVRVECGVNEEPERWGCHLLGLPYDHEISEGFPVVRASVEAPSGAWPSAKKVLENRFPEWEFKAT